MPPRAAPASPDRDRRYLFAVAYRLLGNAADAEDAVQEAFVRLQAASPTNPRAWLTTTTSRICLDMLTSARRRRERYVGTWLPEPIRAADDLDVGAGVDVGSGDMDVADVVALRDSARTAVLLVMQTLTPAERVAFVLHDVFGMGFDQLASIVDRTPVACRQLASRARRRVRDHAGPRATVTPDEQRRVTEAFLEASADGDVRRLVALLDPGVVMRSDGGGALPAARPIHGVQPVLALLGGLGRRYGAVRPLPVELASGAGVVLLLGHDVLGVLAIEIAAGRISELNLVVDPAKLARFR